MIFAARQSRIEQAFGRLRESMDQDARTEAAAHVVLAIFDEFYRELVAYPERAREAFETRDPYESICLSRERLGLYSTMVAAWAPRLRDAWPELGNSGALWDEIEAYVLPLIESRYEADIAYSFMMSIKRNIFRGLWEPVEYRFSPPSEHRARSLDRAYRRFLFEGGPDVEIMREVLRVVGLRAPFRDEEGDARRIVERLDALRASGGDGGEAVALDVIEGGFFRDLNAFVVGRRMLADGGFAPFVLALVHDEDGVRVDALLHSEADVHNLFSSTLANFHVTNELYYQVCVFLHSIMPARPLALHYTTIGFNHVGKVAVFNEMKALLAQSGEVLGFSPGGQGEVAIGFTTPSLSYHLKVIRDLPRESYRWGDYPGVEGVLSKYRLVHEINRTGSMLDNMMYYNLGLDPAMFDPELLDVLCRDAAESVAVDDGRVVIRSLIMQYKVEPVREYLARADEEEKRDALIGLGQCLRNSAASNIFNRDLDLSNYGVGRYHKVFLFDYHAIEPFSDIRLRRKGEEQGGLEFVPESLDTMLGFADDATRSLFCELNADLLELDYWRDLQRSLRAAPVIPLALYPESRRLNPAE